MTYELGDNKHVFINWDLVEPGYGVAWGGSAPTSWEVPRGIQLVVHPPRLDTQPLVQSEYPWEPA